MDFVNYIYFVFGEGGKEHDFVTDATDIIDTVIGSSIHFDYIKERIVKYPTANLTLIAGIPILRIQTIHSPRKNLSDGCLTGSACTTEEISMSKMPGNDGLL